MLGLDGINFDVCMSCDQRFSIANRSNEYFILPMDLNAE